MNAVRIFDKEFRLMIKSGEISACVERLAGRICQQHEKNEVIFIGVLNGAFVFASDLIRRMPFMARVSFVKLASYSGGKSSGDVQELIGLEEDIRGKTVVVLEDIVDTGLTLETINGILERKNPEKITTVTLLFKPDAFRGKVRPDYTGMEIPGGFVIGYGLDYRGYGRGLPDIYMLA